MLIPVALQPLALAIVLGLIVSSTMISRRQLQEGARRDQAVAAAQSVLQMTEAYYGNVVPRKELETNLQGRLRELNSGLTAADTARLDEVGPV